MTPLLLATILGTGLLALLPTRRLAARTSDPWLLGAYFVALWLALAVVVAAPAVRRLAIPLAIALAVAPYLTLRAGVDRLLGRRSGGMRPPPRNVTPRDG